MTKEGLTATLELIKEESDKGDEISVEELVEALNSRGYGPLLIGPALISTLPTGAIPGMPAICGILIILISVQILFAKKHPWIPKRLKEISFSRKKFTNGLEKVKPYTKKIDSFVYPRLEFMVRPEIKPIIAFLCICLASGMIVFGWIPFLPMVAAAAILLMGLGISGRDGAFILASFGLMAISAYLFYSAWGQVMGESGIFG